MMEDRISEIFYDSNEIQKLYESARGTNLDIPIPGTFYSSRCSEALGLKWDVIDFINSAITIRHTVTSSATLR